MAGNDEQIIYKLDLDAAAFMKTLTQVNDRLGSLEKTAKKADIPLLFENAKIALEGFKMAAELVNKTLDLVFDGERIMKVNKTFEILTKTMGISSSEFKENIERATGGLLSEVEALNLANRAMLTMGESSERFSEIITIARKATAVFGGEFKDNLEELTRTISVGNVRALKNQFGVIVDADQALKKYAQSIGVTTQELSEQGKKHAIANAAIDEANKKFKDISPSTTTATAAFKEMKVAIESVKEVVEVVIAKTFGPIFMRVFKDVSAALKMFKTDLEVAFSSDPEVKSKALISSINSVTKQIENMHYKEGETSEARERTYVRLMGKLSEYKSELVLLQEEERKMESLKPKGEKEKEKDRSGDIDKEKVKEDERKFNQDLLSMQEQTTTQQLEVTRSEKEAEKLIEEEYDQAYQELQLRSLQIDEDRRTGKITSEENALALKFELEEQYAAKIDALDASSSDKKIKALENNNKASKSTSEGMANSFKLAGAQSTKALNDFGAQGTRRFNMLNKASANMFREMAKGSKSASEIMKGFIFGLIADEAEASGELHLAKGIASMNPGEVAAGGALIALASVIRGAGGGGASSMGGGGGGQGGGVGAFEPAETPSPQQQQAPKKSVTIQIQGSYFETEQTKQRLMEMIRDQTDATDFKYVQIGSR